LIATLERYGWSADNGENLVILAYLTGIIFANASRIIICEMKAVISMMLVVKT